MQQHVVFCRFSKFILYIKANYTRIPFLPFHPIVPSIILSRSQKFEQSILYEQCYILIEQAAQTVSSVNVSNASDLLPKGPAGH
jgi:hypothetical protein